MSPEVEMAEDSRSFFRYLFIATAAAFGLVHILWKAPAGDDRSVLFAVNAWSFFFVYSALYFYQWIPFPKILRFLFFPMSLLLDILLGVSCFLWVAYALQAFKSPQAELVWEYIWFILPLFGLVYISLGRPLLGVSRSYRPWLEVVSMLFFAGLFTAGLIYLELFMGRPIDRWVHDEESRFLVRVTLWTISALLGAAFAPRLRRS